MKELRHSLSAHRACSDPNDIVSGSRYITQAYLSLGDTQEASEPFRENIYLLERPHINPPHERSFPFVSAQAGLEEGPDDTRDFYKFCREFLVGHPAAGKTPFQQWYLEKVEISHLARELMSGSFSNYISQDWVWQGPFGDCSCTVTDGVEIP